MEESSVNNKMELFLRPVWSEIDRANDVCGLFLDKLGIQSEAKDALCMIICEILENAIKYGLFKDENQEFPLKIESSHDGMLVQVWSPVGSYELAEHLGRLDAIIQWIRSFQSPFQAYLERLKLVAGQPLDDGESGLGLIRIAYEGEAILDFFVSEDDILHVSALRPRSKFEQRGLL